MSDSSKKANSANDTSRPDDIKIHKVTQLVEQLIRAKCITYTQYQTLSKMVLADGTIDEQERCQINRLFDAIKTGAVRIVE